MRDFTLKIYKQLLLTLLEKGYTFLTFEQFCKGQCGEKVIVLRHDVDLKAESSLQTAIIENDLEIKASYYFRVVRQSNKPDIIRKIVSLGHEVGYHYEDMALCKGNYEHAFEHFKDKLEYFRKYYPVKTICMHGSPREKFDNKDLWKKYNYTDFGIIGEPYFDLQRINPEMYYLTDTGRMWDGARFSIRDKMENQILNIHSTSDLINTVNLSSLPENVMITTHPQRWTDNFIKLFVDNLAQRIKNVFKFLLKTF